MTSNTFDFAGLVSPEALTATIKTERRKKIDAALAAGIEQLKRTGYVSPIRLPVDSEGHLATDTQKQRDDIDVFIKVQVSRVTDHLNETLRAGREAGLCLGCALNLASLIAAAALAHIAAMKVGYASTKAGIDMSAPKNEQRTSNAIDEAIAEMAEGAMGVARGELTEHFMMPHGPDIIDYVRKAGATVITTEEELRAFFAANFPDDR